MSSNPRIKVLNYREHSKASEKYADVIFTYPGGFKWEGSIPTEYRRTGTSIKTKEEFTEHIEKAYDLMNPNNQAKWLKEEENFWSKFNKKITQDFFDGLKDSNWKCVNCELPNNPNWARRIQDIKEMGYTLATNTKKFCKNCGRNRTHLILVKFPRSHETGYETWSPKLRSRILNVLNSYDVYEDVKRAHLLPDHKFPEIRWDKDTKEENPDDMTENEIKIKFQLLSNQRNQQKREVCRNCFQTGKRGIIFGIKYYYKGGENWSKKIQKIGKLAEKGCEGCPWHDIQEWRNKLSEKLLML